MVTILEEPPSGRRLGWLEPVIPALPEARRFSALAIECPEPSCPAGIDEACPDRPHASRIQAALSAVRRGELPEAPEPIPAADGDVREPCQFCYTRVRQDVTLSCENPAHRCTAAWWTEGGRRCARPSVKNGRCEVHPHTGVPMARRWADNGRRRATVGGTERA